MAEGEEGQKRQSLGASAPGGANGQNNNIILPYSTFSSSSNNIYFPLHADGLLDSFAHLTFDDEALAPNTSSDDNKKSAPSSASGSVVLVDYPHASGSSDYSASASGSANSTLHTHHHHHHDVVGSASPSPTSSTFSASSTYSVASDRQLLAGSRHLAPPHLNAATASAPVSAVHGSSAMATNSIKLLTGNSHPQLAKLVADR